MITPVKDRSSSLRTLPVDITTRSTTVTHPYDTPLDAHALRTLKQRLDILRMEAADRLDHRHELLANCAYGNLLVAEMLQEVAHGLNALYARLPLESGTSTDWITPRRTA